MEQIIQLHKQVSQDIEYKIFTSDNNFCQCYFRYLSLYRKIIAKRRGQALVAALASAYAHFGKDRDRNYLPILHNCARIKVQPTAISQRKSGIKSSTAQPSGRCPKLSPTTRKMAWELGKFLTTRNAGGIFPLILGTICQMLVAPD